ncbi:response regulator [Candidatus Chloroploca sp. M-50]|uniref:Response regulator n=1 Tax=Candidatus Chloroploca mongolica TaxID=2528176 RepID=A0ABS4DBR1_9CHLR|nr:response regulator [Candidatus Chloroploca mongolica]MBP1466875.1 response regulator [Candidatus Chloroploca mongolica]
MSTILVVDDYAPNHRLMSFVLENHGYAVVSAHDGVHALECLATVPIDLMVTDLTMPRLDGLALVERIRSDPRYARMPIVIVTASSKETDEIKAAGIGVNAFLTKPVDSEDLAQTVAQLLTQEVSRPDSPFLKTGQSAA